MTSMRNLIRRSIESGRSYLYDVFGVRIDVHPRRPRWVGETRRFDYQEQYVDFVIRPGERVLDIGSGGDPFPYATVLVDRFLETNPTRHEQLVTANKPFVLADVHDLPFPDQSFDFVYCVHVLEVVADPLKACAELMRVGRRGFIETPTAAKDMLFAWARGEQRWQVVGIGDTLCFFEYSERQLDGIGSLVWRDLIFSPRHNPIQEAFYHNQDIFNVMFLWEGRFRVFVFRQDGTIQTIDTAADVAPQLVFAS
jgi:SAM-dependent methyltransferase